MIEFNSFGAGKQLKPKPVKPDVEDPNKTTNKQEVDPDILMSEKNKPLTLYRGSSSPLDENKKYDNGRLGHSTGAPSAKEAFFFSNRMKTAAYYSRGKNPNKERAVRMGETPHIDRVNLVMKNPFIYDFKGKVFREKTYCDLIKKAKENGHDGVIFKNTYDAGEYNRFDAMMRGRLIPEIIYAVFEPGQVKIIDQTETVSPRIKQKLESKGP